MEHNKRVARKEIIQTERRILSQIHHTRQVICQMGDFYHTIASFHDNQLAFQVIRDSFF